jgi:hypothetical protein
MLGDNTVPFPPSAINKELTDAVTGKRDCCRQYSFVYIFSFIQQTFIVFLLCPDARGSVRKRWLLASQGS